MMSSERLARLELLVLNQALIIGQLTHAMNAMMPPAVRELALDRSAEELLELIFIDGVPLTALELSVEWRQQIAGHDITRTSG
ncbi:hypothetical protein [Pseudohongiella acticola]|uniref:hypothetical protein n=1 Tax=Pseudohongiella acticola TaxID=1524254 RepID=UPI0030EC8BC0